MEKSKGWMGESARHRLAQMGIKTANRGDWRMKKAQALAAEGELSWKTFQDIFGEKSEEMLEKLINDQKAEVEGEEVSEDDRLWKNQTQIEVEGENGDLERVVIDNNSLITFL